MNVKNILTSMALKYEMDLYEKEWDHFSFLNKTLYIMKDKKDKFYYVYLVLNYSDLVGFLDIIQPEIYVYLKDYFEIESGPIYTGFEKNTTLIIFSDADKGVSDICEYIEEDSSYFKKQIIGLSEKERDYIAGLVDNDFANIIDETIINRNEFDKFFKGDSSLPYSVAAKFYEKLPFLTLNRNDSNYIDINEILDRNLDDKNKILLNYILEFDFDNNVKNIEEIL